MEKELLNYVVHYKTGQELEEILQQLEQKNDFDIIKQHKNTNIYTTNEIIENGRNFFNEYFTLQNVYYYPKNIYKFYTHKKIQKIIKSIIPDSPLNIPINLNLKTDNSSVVHTNIYTNNTFDKILINKIIIANNNLANEFYAHEIAHTQQQTYNEITNETIPIFLEKLSGQYFKHEKEIEEFRLRELYLYILELLNIKLLPSEKLINIKYIESTLKAYLLFHLYQTETLSSTRARIIDEINESFSNQITIEEILNNHGITNNNYKKLTLEHKII